MRAVPKWERKTLHHPLAYTRLRAWIGGWKNRLLFEDLKYFLLFTGYPRSGHSLIGSLLDAHPNMVIANQLNALDFFEHDYSKRQVSYLILENSRREAAGGRSNSKYDHSVSGQWQGRHDKILVIGDKRGGSSADKLSRKGHPGLLEKVENTMGVPLKVLHIVRNPFDNITTMITRTLKNSGRAFSEELWAEKASVYFQKAKNNDALIQGSNAEVLTIHQEQFVASPGETLREICHFTGLTAEQQYLDDCSAVIWPQPNQSRFKVDFWTQERIESVRSRKQAFSFLADYKWES